MKLVSIKLSLFQLYTNDKEILTKDKRPYVLVLKLKYKNKTYDFAIPVRLNIPAATPKSQYFALPPRPTTKPGNRHGLHYIKMFPVQKKYLVKYRTEGNQFATMIQKIIDKNSKQIVSECQQYLTNYENGIKLAFSTNIDFLINQLQCQTLKKCLNLLWSVGEPREI